MKKKVNFKERGITLVALVITIIILLILAGVTINTALSENGLFRMAKKAVNEYQEAEKQEQTALDDIAKEMEKISIDYNDYVGATVTGYDITNKKIEGSEFIIKSETSGVEETDRSTNDNIKENLEQKFTTEELGWKIWDYDKYTKTIRLISAKATETQLTLKGATGYNNGVWAINEICRQCYGQYDENNQMKRGISVANLRRTDIQKVSTYDYTKYKHTTNSPVEVTNGTEAENENLIYFGESKTYTENKPYPNMWGKYDSKWTYKYDKETSETTGSDKECEMWERENGDGKMTEEGTGITTPTFKQSYYLHDYKKDKNEFINEQYYKLLFYNEDENTLINKIYWLAGRYTLLYGNYYTFGLQVVNTENSFSTVGGVDLRHANRWQWYSKLLPSSNDFY